MQLLTPETLRSLPAVILPKLISLFSSTTPPLLTEIRQHATQGEWQAMAQAAHKLKGSCVSLGASAMAEICATLQYKGEQQDLSQAPVLLKQLQQLYPATLDALQATAPA